MLAPFLSELLVLIHNGHGFYETLLSLLLMEVEISLLMPEESNFCTVSIVFQRSIVSGIVPDSTT